MKTTYVAGTRKSWGKFAEDLTASTELEWKTESEIVFPWRSYKFIEVDFNTVKVHLCGAVIDEIILLDYHAVRMLSDQDINLAVTTGMFEAEVRRKKHES